MNDAPHKGTLRLPKKKDTVEASMGEDTVSAVVDVLPPVCPINDAYARSVVLDKMVQKARNAA